MTVTASAACAACSAARVAGLVGMLPSPKPCRIRPVAPDDRAASISWPISGPAAGTAGIWAMPCASIRSATACSWARTSAIAAGSSSACAGRAGPRRGSAAPCQQPIPAWASGGRCGLSKPANSVVDDFSARLPRSSLPSKNSATSGRRSRAVDSAPARLPSASLAAFSASPSAVCTNSGSCDPVRMTGLDSVARARPCPSATFSRKDSAAAE